jgi:hypothetical protein
MKILTAFRSTVYATILLSSGCDLENGGLKIFSDQGLTLLQPARSYVKVGGLVVSPRRGHLQYLDPFNTIGSEPGTFVDFTAVIYGQTRNQSARLSVAVDSLRKIVSLPIGITYSSGEDVNLSQIDSSGTRLPTDKVSALIKQEATADAIKEQLALHNRVFVVQEVYTANGLTLTSSNNAAIDATVGGKVSVPDCSSTGGGADKIPSGQPEDVASTGGESIAPTNGSGAKNQNSQSNTASTSQSAEQKSAKAKSSGPAGKKDASSQGDSVGVCKSSSSSLKFQSKTPIPFAVRLNEIVSAPGGLLVKIGTFHLASPTLGNADVEQATAFIDQSNPVLRGLVPGRQ